MKPALNHLFLAIVTALFGASLFFTARVVTFQRSLNVSAGAQAFKSGQKARVVTVIEADEVVVNTGANQVTVRLLGVYGFDPMVGDPVAQPAGRAAQLHVENLLRGQEVELVFDELKFDASKRLLAYIHKGGADVGLELVASGLCLAYSKYPFSRLDAYLQAGDAAQRNRLGLWADPRLVERSSAIRTLWDAERTRGN